MNQSKNKLISMRLSVEEYKRLEQNAKTLGISKSELIRRSAIYGKNISPTIIDMEPLRKLYSELAHEGSNLNQLAHEANVFGIDSLLEHRILEELESYKKTREALVALIKDIRAGELNV
jgi:predicted DNA-binding protein